jgi:hypothetical protein
MSVPAPRPPENDGRWGTIRYALEDWGRTLRFCLIWLVVITAPAVAGYAAAHPLAELIRPMLLCGPGCEMVDPFGGCGTLREEVRPPDNTFRDRRRKRIQRPRPAPSQCIAMQDTTHNQDKSGLLAECVVGGLTCGRS